MPDTCGVYRHGYNLKSHIRFETLKKEKADQHGVAEKALADDASVIFPSPAFMAILVHRAGLAKIQNPLVLDTISVTVKTAEMLVELKRIGVEPSRRSGVYPKPDKEVRKDTFEKFKKIFKIED